MKRWIIGVCATLILAAGGASSPFTSARAQGLVEYALILVLVSVAVDEINEFTWYPDAGRDRNENGAPNVGNQVTFTYIVTNVGASNADGCRQSLDAAIGFGDGINGMRLQVGPNGESLFVNGQLVGMLNDCFLGEKRVSVEIGVTLPSAAARDFGGPGPMPAPPGLNKPVFLTSSLVSPDGSTLARSDCGGIDQPYVVLKVPNPVAR